MIYTKKTALLLSALGTATLGIGTYTIQRIDSRRASNAKRIAVFAYEDISPLREAVRGIADTLRAHDVAAEVTTYYCHQDFIQLHTQINAAVTNNVDLCITIGATISQKVAALLQDKAPNIAQAFMGVSDPLNTKLVTALPSRPENITGIAVSGTHSDLTRDLAMMRRVCPYLSKIMIPYNDQNETLENHVQLLSSICHEQGIAVKLVPVTDHLQIQALVGGLLDESYDLLLVLRDYTIIPAIPLLARYCEQFKTVLFALDSDSVNQGAGASFAPREYEIGQEVGVIAASILKGRQQAGNIPVKVLDLDKITKLQTSKSSLARQLKREIVQNLMMEHVKAKA